jgi:hypothetical protein
MTPGQSGARLFTEDLFHRLALGEFVDEFVQAADLAHQDFFAHAPRMNPSRSLITGVVCGVRVEEIQEPMMREIRRLDKLIDELAKGKAMEKILRK